MYIQSIALLVAGLMATTSIASSLPGPAPVDGLTPISSQKLENGHSVIVYGAGDPHVSRRDDNIEDEDEDELERRQWFGPKKEKYCHVDKTPNCDDKNGGPTELCQELVNQLYGYRERTQPSDARQYCIKGQTEKYCCVKWTKEAKDLTNGDLADAVDTGKSHVL
ncbi:hypothetical protein CC86DRAFT_370135 [Ophiobolus disseminans]|uniref:Uncharacterized protein n=1 Tax=Ophiobolus disseminans TaxID=1469910 RepID=A0A6A7A1T0_9PLEO|nr:hypothetical protein CC86DRAFT_370135 [Ophiobolus disseminans]